MAEKQKSGCGTCDGHGLVWIKAEQAMVDCWECGETLSLEDLKAELNLDNPHKPVNS